MRELTTKKDITNTSRRYFEARRERVAGAHPEAALPGNAWFLEDGEVLCLPRDDGDCRYPYGTGGANFWAYGSGYMHSNKGLFSPFLRSVDGQEPKIAFFATTPGLFPGRHPVLPLLPVPTNDHPDRAGQFAVLTKTAAWWLTETPELFFSVRVFADEDHRIWFTVNVENRTPTSVGLSLSTYLNPFLMHDIVENGETKWFREVRYRDETTPGDFEFETRENLSRTHTTHHHGLARRSITLGTDCCLAGYEATTSRYQYVGGSRRSLHNPASVAKGTFGGRKVHLTTFTETGIAGDLMHLVVGPGATVRTDVVFGYAVHSTAPEPLSDLRNLSLDPEAVDAVLGRLEATETCRSRALRVSVMGPPSGPVTPECFNPFFEHLKRQVEFCSLIEGYVQLSHSSLIGIRDVFQALEALVVWRPQEARTKMLEALGFVDPSGRCPRQYALPVGAGASPVMDLRPFIDQGVWVISTVVTYLKTTGDLGFLNEVCGYHEIVDEKAKIVQASSLRDSVFEHLRRILGYLLSNRDLGPGGTGCVRALFGDWNDALDGLGVSLDSTREYGTGVSVMASLQVYQNLVEMVDLLEFLDPALHEDDLVTYRQAALDLKSALLRYAVVDEQGDRRIVHGWGDARAYLVGGFHDPDGRSRHGLTSNAFWVLSGLLSADPSLEPVILKAFEALGSPYGLKTFEPPFAPDTPGVGRIPKLPPGTAENGAAYTHASLFGAWALFRLGQGEAGWRELERCLPFTHRFVSGSPYVMPNSYGHNPTKNIDGESMLDWQTGSSNVLFKILVREVFGIVPDHRGLWIQPATGLPFGGFSVELRARGCLIRLRHRRTPGGSRRFLVGGVERRSGDEGGLRGKCLWIPDAELAAGILDIEVVD